MKNERHITASCKISNHLVVKNGVTVYNNGHTAIPEFLASVYNYTGLNYPRFYKMDNPAKLGWLASEILMKDSFMAEKYLPDETGIIISNANASCDTDLKYIESVKDIPSPSVFVYTLPNIMIGEICIKNNFKGENSFFIAETFDAQFLYHYIESLFENNILRACIFGWVDLLGDDYSAVLFLAEKEQQKESVLFSPENIDKIYNTDYVQQD